MTDIKDRIIEWLLSGDTGASSKYMAYICVGITSCPNNYPYDPSDFGRCYRFLRAIPEARDNLHKLKDSGPVWAAYVDRWDEMERMYEDGLLLGKSPELLALMLLIQKECGE